MSVKNGLKSIAFSLSFCVFVYLCDFVSFHLGFYALCFLLCAFLFVKADIGMPYIKSYKDTCFALFSLTLALSESFSLYRQAKNYFQECGFGGKGKLLALAICVVLAGIAAYSLLAIAQHAFSNNGKNDCGLGSSAKLNSKITTVLALMAVSFLFALCFSVASPLEKGMNGNDYSIFYLIGKRWTEGYLPYRDLFDHKGPLIFAIYSLGISINESRGIYFLQAVSLFISLFFAYKIVQKNMKPSAKGFVAVAAVLAFIAPLQYGEALTEEFSLPLLMASAYFVDSFFKDYRSGCEHAPKHAMLYGVTVAASLCMRVTNSAAVCAWVAVISVLLVANKKYINLLKNAAMFLTGFFAVILPFSIYFISNGAFDDFVNGTVLYNLRYASGSTSDFGITSLISRMRWLWPVWVAITVSLVNRAGNKALRYANAFAIVATVAVTVFGNEFEHYLIIFAVFIPLYLNRIELALSAAGKKLRCGAVALLVCFTVAFNCIAGMSLVLGSRPNSALEKLSKDIAVCIPLEEYDSVAGYNTPSLFYVYSGLTSCCKYFTLQDWQSEKSAVMLEENVEFYSLSKASHVVVFGEIGVAEIRKAIEANYSIVKVFEENGISAKLYAANG